LKRTQNEDLEAVITHIYYGIGPVDHPDEEDDSLMANERLGSEKVSLYTGRNGRNLEGTEAL